MKRTVLIIVSAIVLLGGAAALVLSALGNSVPYKYVNDVMAAPDDWVGKTTKVHGQVEPGSIEETIENQTTKTTFVLHYKGKRITVKHEGSKPDTFRDDAEVVATGKLAKAEAGEDGEYVFHAKELLAKCPSKYEAAGSTLDKRL